MNLDFTNPLLERAFLFLEDGKWEEANKYCEKTLDLEPKNAVAYLGKLMSDFHIHTVNQLEECAVPLSDNDNYAKILRFGNDGLINSISEYNSAIIKRNQELLIKMESERLEKLYAQAVNCMNSANTGKELRIAASSFDEINNYKDSSELRDHCIKNAITKENMENKRNKTLRNRIIAIIASCLAVVSLMTFVIGTYIIPSNQYNKALDFIANSQYEEAYLILSKLEYKDSKEQMKKIEWQYNICIIQKASVGDIVNFGLYEQDGDDENGKEPIEWRILAKNQNKYLLICEYGIDVMQFHSPQSDINWESSMLRQWLNKDFINDAFNQNEKAIISNTTVKSKGQIMWGDVSSFVTVDDGNDTIDKIFLLSPDEAYSYFPTNKSRELYLTRYAMQKSGQSKFAWWLRTKGATTTRISFVDQDGDVEDNGSFVDLQFAIRPAMWIAI